MFRVYTAVRQALLRMTDEEILEFWGSEQLVRWPRDQLHHSPLPETAKAFLAEVGLPRAVGFTLRLGPALQPQSPPNAWFVLGCDDEIIVAIEPMSHACISFDESTTERRFINSDIRKFAVCLTFYEHYRRQGRGLEESEVLKLITAIERSNAVRGSHGFFGFGVSLASGCRANENRATVTAISIVR